MHGKDGTGKEIQLKTEQLRILRLIFSGKHINYSKQVTEGTFKPIMSFYLLKIIQNVENNMVNKRKQLTGRLLHQ
jgi:hypothetical protein